jgi:hypothetical protein
MFRYVATQGEWVDIVFVSYLIAVVVSLAVGVPTTVRSLRRQDTPLVLLGAAVTIDGLEWLAWTLANYTPAYETALGEALSITCRLGISVSVVLMVSFTRTAFRPASRGAMAGVLLIAGALIFAFVGSGAVGDWSGVRNDHFGVWLEQIALLSGYGWTSLEAGHQYIQAKRRASYGLSDVIVANRFLLWSLYAGLFFLAEIIYVIALAFYGMLSDLDALNAFLTVAAELALCLAIFPPAWYKRAITGMSNIAVR